MSGQKRPAGTELIVNVEGPSCKKRGVTMKTVDKWIAENDKALNMTTWLQCDRKDREYVASMKCIRYQDWFRGVGNVVLSSAYPVHGSAREVNRSGADAQVVPCHYYLVVFRPFVECATQVHRSGYLPKLT